MIIAYVKHSREGSLSCSCYTEGSSDDPRERISFNLKKIFGFSCSLPFHRIEIESFRQYRDETQKTVYARMYVRIFFNLSLSDNRNQWKTVILGPIAI